MQIFLSVVATIAIGVLMLIVFPMMLVRWKVRQLLRSLGSASASFQFLPPFQISLEPDNGHEWEQPEVVERVAAEFDRLGFVRVGTFRTEPPTVPHESWHLPDENVYAVIFEESVRGIWVDLWQEAENGHTLTVTTAEDDFLVPPEFATVIRLPDAEPAELLDRLRQEREGQRPAIATSAERYVAAYEGLWQRTMAFHLERGGPTESEIRHIADALGLSKDLSPERLAGNVQEVRDVWLSAIGEFRSQQLLDAFLAQANRSGDDWDRIKHRLIFVHDALPPFDVVLLIDDLFAIEDQIENNDDASLRELIEKLHDIAESRPPRDAFPLMNAELHASCRFEPFGEVLGAVSADVYLAPELGPEFDLAAVTTSSAVDERVQPAPRD